MLCAAEAKRVSDIHLQIDSRLFSAFGLSGPFPACRPGSGLAPHDRICPFLTPPTSARDDTPRLRGRSLESRSNVWIESSFRAFKKRHRQCAATVGRSVRITIFRSRSAYASPYRTTAQAT